MKNSLNVQRSNSLIIKPKVKTPENPETKPVSQSQNFQILLEQNADKPLSIGSRLGVQKQVSAESMPNTSRSFSLTSLPHTPQLDLLRTQSHIVKDRSNAFKLYAKPLVLNSSNQINSGFEKLITPSDKSLSPFDESYQRPREIKRDVKAQEASDKISVLCLTKSTTAVSKQQAALEAGLMPGILPQKRQHASTLNKAILAKKILEQIENTK